MTRGQILVLFQIVAESWWLWCLWCLYRVVKQKKAHLQAVSMCAKAAANSGNKDWRKYYEVYEKVGFGKHLFYLLTFRNPAKLYEHE